MRGARAIIALAVALACATRIMFAEDRALAEGAAPANTLVDLQRQFGACMAGKSAGKRDWIMPSSNDTG